MPLPIADVSLDGLSLNGRLFRSQAPPAEYEAVLGVAARVVDPGPPAPHGHRNNQVHLFDQFGVYLTEHHATRLATSITFVLWLDEAVFRPAREFVGELRVGGVPCAVGAFESDLVGNAIPFSGPSLGLWSASQGEVWVGVRVRGRRKPSGRRGRQMRVVDVSVCFSTPLT